MKQYNTNQKKKIVLIINKAKNKKVQALKFNISIRTYYYWKKKLEETDSIENRSRKPKNSPNKLKNKKSFYIQQYIKALNFYLLFFKKFAYYLIKLFRFYSRIIASYYISLSVYQKFTEVPSYFFNAFFCWFFCFQINK